MSKNYLQDTFHEEIQLINFRQKIITNKAAGSFLSCIERYVNRNQKAGVLLRMLANYCISILSSFFYIKHYK